MKKCLVCQKEMHSYAPFGSSFTALCQEHGNTFKQVEFMQKKLELLTPEIEQIAIERKRQIEEEGYTEEHDAQHSDKDFIDAAMAYLSATIGTREDGLFHWPWNDCFFKPTATLRDLEKAGALIAAAIARLKAEENKEEKEVGKWDASNWPNSKIMRPKDDCKRQELPEWCKVGAWVYQEVNGFGKVIDFVTIGENIKPKVRFTGGCGPQDIGSLKEAHLHPWTKEGCPLILKLKYNGEFAVASMCNHAKDGWGYFIENSKKTIFATMEEIAKNGEQLDGSPCGTLKVVKMKNSKKEE